MTDAMLTPALAPFLIWLATLGGLSLLMPLALAALGPRPLPPRTAMALNAFGAAALWPLAQATTDGTPGLLVHAGLGLWFGLSVMGLARHSERRPLPRLRPADMPLRALNGVPKVTRNRSPSA